MLKNKWFLICFLCVFGRSDWVAKVGTLTLFEKDFYTFFPKNEWRDIKDVEQKERVFFGFLKQSIAAYNAESLGLQYRPGVVNKLDARFNMLLVNEYYMRHFLGTLIPHSSLMFCKQNLKKELFVKHILLKTNKENPQQNKDVSFFSQQIKDSLLLGSSFESLAVRHSEDPGVVQNRGALGWVSLGQTVPVFQDAIFGLCLGCVDVVQTEFGFHVIKVDSIRNSKYFGLDVNLYDDYAFRFSTAYISSPLKELAAEHDTLLIKTNKVQFRQGALLEIIDLIEKEKVFVGGGRKNVDVLKILENYQKIVVSYNGNLLSGAWFAHKIKTSLHQNVFYSSLEEIKREFYTIILRDIAFRRAVELGLDQGFSFVSQYINIRSSVLEKAYLNFLIESVVPPTPKEVEAYFVENNKKQQSLDVAYNSIKTILLQQKQKQAKQRFLESIDSLENILINKGWLDE